MMNFPLARRAVPFGAVPLAFALVVVLPACRKKDASAPPVATATVTLNRTRAPLGSPIDITYKFVVSSDARFAEDYRVMAHVVDSDDQLMFTFDHQPPVPTTQWRPGQTIEYTRTEFLPVYPYVGDASIDIGMYSPTTQKRLPLAGHDRGQLSYRVARLQLQPQTENLFTVFKDGWHPTETADQGSRIEWQWTKKTATLAFKNPKKDSTLYLEADNPAGDLKEPQQVRVVLGGQPVDAFTIRPGQPATLRKVALKADRLGDADMVELQIEGDKTFVPAQIPGASNKDARELGVRVFHAVVQPNA
jgi:hypothetical protein